MHNEDKLKKIVEKFADIEHKRWIKWMEYMWSMGVHSGSDIINIRTIGFSTNQYKQWERQMETDYADLSDQEKESDREQVYPYIEAMKSYAEEYAREYTRGIYKRERAYWISVFDNRPKDRDLESDQIAQNFARIEIDRIDEILKNLNKE